MQPNAFAGAISLMLCTLPLVGQESEPQSNTVPLYRVTVIERTINAINYKYRSGPTRIDFRGTILMPEAKGEARVESKRGRTEIDARFEKLVPPAKFGREYLTYILWAITPEGGPHNVGEIIPGSSNRANLEVTTDLQAFALLVTAERYAAVRQPSDVVVLENQVRSDTVGKIQQLSAKYELMPRGHYVWNKPDNPDRETDSAPKVSMREYEAIAALYQAENAIGIASAANALRYAPDTIAKAQQLLAAARQWQAKGHASQRVVENAREAAQAAEDARTIAERRRQAEQMANAEAEIFRERQARVEAESEAQRARAEVEASRTRSQPAEAKLSADKPISSTERVEVTVAVDKSSLRRQLLESLRSTAAPLDTPRGLVANIPDEGFNGAALTGAAYGQTMRIAAIVAAHPGLRINVEGHSDSAAREDPSGERTRAVRDALMRGGLSSEAISTRDLKNTRPIVSSGRANRRVEIVIYGEPIGNLPLWDRTYSLVPGGMLAR